MTSSQATRVTPIQRSNAVIQQVSDETLVTIPGEGAVHVLNPTARFIWDLCDGEHTIPDIAGALRTEFVAPDEYDVRTDVEQIIENFAAKGLLR